VIAPFSALPLWLLPLAPLVAAVICAIIAVSGSRRAGKITPVLTVFATLISGLIAAAHFPQGEKFASQTYEWLTIRSGITITLSVHLDALAWTMVAVVTFVSLLVQIYSTGYMKGEPGYARYFACVSMFTCSMLGLVLADNLFQLYVCWELVGICSYLLIGFWWTKKSAADASKKAFIVTRFGDVGFFLGVLLLVSAAGSFQFSAVETTINQIANGQLTALPLFSAQTFLVVAPLLLFCGAVGKSAQFPLHVWLPDAMEGPTPVSALIHAATMVAAGVYMVARLLPIFAASQVVMNVVIITGSLTALIAATIALVQTDIKKVMAYSTISQLGYMFVGLGVGNRDAGMFHLVTHAMFKALLFLTAGSVIHALHHSAAPNDMRLMGGLGKRMRVTAITCGIGVLALAGLPGLSGFWSKDAILGAALEKHTPVANIALVVALLVAALTAFYSCRMWLLTFAGEPRSKDAEHAHEGPASMTVPLALLAVLSVVLGIWLHANGRFTSFLAAGKESAPEGMTLWLVGLASICSLAGIFGAWLVYGKTYSTTDPVEKAPGYALFVNLWYVEAFWTKIAARGALATGRAVAWFDRTVIDGLVNVVGGACQLLGNGLRRSATGQTQLYTTVVMAGLVIVALAVAIMQSGGR